MDNSMNRANDSSSNNSNKQTPVSPASSNPCEGTYSSQLSLESANPPVDPFTRDAIGRRSMSEKRHATLDAKETGTYQRNKKLREDRERRSRGLTSASLGSMDSLVNTGNSSNGNGDLSREALDRIGDLGPSLGLKKSSSLESLQTIVQGMQLSGETRGQTPLRTPRGRGREEYVRAEVERRNAFFVNFGCIFIHSASFYLLDPRKQWMFEENAAAGDNDGGFMNRHGPFQSSLNEGKNKRAKKPSLLRGIGHMFRFGKHRKDGIVPAEASSEVSTSHALPSTLSSSMRESSSSHKDKSNHGAHTIGRSGPPNYQPPPPVAIGIPVSNGGIHHNDVFNHRYSHYVNYDDMQQQMRYGYDLYNLNR